MKKESLLIAFLIALMFGSALVSALHFGFSIASEKDISNVTVPSRYDSANSTSILPPSTPIVQKESNGSYNLVSPQQSSYYHWWEIDYWATSDDQLPPKMNGTFTAVANSISGLASPDAILYIPLNVAYGTSSNNCVWFQFDVEFDTGHTGWYIWDVLGPASSNPADFHCQAIGISYIVGDVYNFELTTSGTNTVTFSIKDVTSGVSWSISSWKWTVPSLTMLYDPLVFSPASAIEGYTTNLQLANVPYFQTYVGYNLPTVSGPVFYGDEMPSGIGTQVSGGPGYYWWSMFNPPPTVTVTATGLSEPIGVAVTPDGTYAYVTNGGSDSVSVISTATNTVTATTPVGNLPSVVAVTPDGAYAYVTTTVGWLGGGSVSVISTATNTVTATIPVGYSPSVVAFTPNGAYAYVTDYLSNYVSVISTATNTVTATIPVGSGPGGVAVTPDGAYAYVTNGVSNYVSVISTATNTVTATIPVGSGPGDVAITPDGAYAYVTNVYDYSVSVISTATNTVTATIPVGSRPGGVAITPDGAYAYVTNVYDYSVSVISTATNTVTATIPVGNGPFDVAVTPDGAYAYVTNYVSNYVSVISTATNTVTATIPGIDPAGPLTMDAGQSQLFTATPLDGSGVIHYQWYVGAVAVGTDSSTYSYTASGSSASVTCKVTDSASPPVTSPASNAVSVTVNPALTASVAPTLVTMDVGQSQRFTCAASGGTGTLHYQWYLAGSAVSGETGTSYSFTASSSGSPTIYCEVTDEASSPLTVQSNTPSFTVNSALVAPTVTATKTSLNVPLGVAVAPNGAYAYVTNYGSDTVSVISTATNTVTATVTVGSTPWDVAVTPDGAYAYVANYGSDTVSVINTATNTVTATITVEANPIGVAVTPNGAYAYITNYFNRSVSVINTATNKVTATVGGLSDPFGIAVTPNGAYAYVANGGSGTVSVINTATNTVTATINVGTYPIGVAVTPNGAHAYITNYGSGTVSVISTATNTVTATVTVGSEPWDVAVTPDGAYAYVANGGSSTVSVISTATNTVMGTVTVGSGPVGVAVTPDGAYAYVTNAVSNTVSVINTITNALVSFGTVDQGQTSSLTSTAVTTGTSPYTYEWFVKAPGSSYSLISGATLTSYSFVTSTLTATGTWSFILQLTDNTGAAVNSTTATVTVTASPTVIIAPVGSFTIDVGQSKLFVATPAGGSGVYTSYQWYVSDMAQIGQTASAFNFAPGSAGYALITVTVTDSLGSTSPQSSATSIKVNSALVAPSVSVLPAIVDQGQSSILSATDLSGGTAPYSYQWFEIAPGGSYVAVGANSSSFSFITFGSGSLLPSATATGTWNFILQVTDSIGVVANSPEASVIVNSALVSPSTSALLGTVDQGQTAGLTSSIVTTGTFPYTFQWFEKAPGGSYGTVGSNLPSFSFVTSSTTTSGSWSFILQVTDKTGATANSTATSVTVNGVPTVSISPTSWTMDVGQSELFIATPAGGSGTYTSYQWFVNGVVQDGATNSTFNYAPVSTGSPSITATVTDSIGGTSTQSSASTITVNYAISTPACSATANTVTQGQSSTVSVTGLSGGTAPYTYQWLSESPGSTMYLTISGATSSTYTFTTSTSTTTGAWNFILQVADNAGAAMNSTFAAVSVNSPTPIPTSTPFPITTPTATPTTAPTTAPASTPSASSNQLPSPSPTVPEFPSIVIDFVALLTASAVIMQIVKKPERQGKRQEWR